MQKEFEISGYEKPTEIGLKALEGANKGGRAKARPVSDEKLYRELVELRATSANGTSKTELIRRMAKKYGRKERGLAYAIQRGEKIVMQRRGKLHG